MQSEKKTITILGRLIRVRAMGMNMVGKKPMKENIDIIRPVSAKEMPNDFVNISGSQASMAKELKAPTLNIIITAHPIGHREADSFVFLWFSGKSGETFSIKSQGTTAISANIAQLPVETRHPTACVKGTAMSEGSPALT